MTHDLLHGDLAAAVVDNVFLLVGLPALLAWILVRWRTRTTDHADARDRRHRRRSPITWTVVRNLPGFPLVPTLLDG